MNTKTNELTSVGKMSAILQRHPSTLKRTAEDLGIEPALTLNGTPYYSVEAVERLRVELRSDTRPLEDV